MAKKNTKATKATKQTQQQEATTMKNGIMGNTQLVNADLPDVVRIATPEKAGTIAEAQLRKPAEIQKHYADFSDKSLAVSLLFYAICQGNVLDFKGAKPSAVKRILGNDLFKFMPMNKIAKNTGEKEIYQIFPSGNDAMTKHLKNIGKDSIAEMIGLPAEVSMGMPNSYFQEFKNKLQLFIDAEKTAKGKAKDAAKKEKEQEQADKDKKLADKFKAYVAKVGADKAIDKDTWITRLEGLEETKAALEVLLNAATKAELAFNGEIIDALNVTICDEERALNG